MYASAYPGLAFRAVLLIKPRLILDVKHARIKGMFNCSCLAQDIKCACACFVFG